MPDCVQYSFSVDHVVLTWVRVEPLTCIKLAEDRGFEPLGKPQEIASDLQLSECSGVLTGHSRPACFTVGC